MAVQVNLKLASPIAVYLDESMEGSPLAPRPSSLEGKVVGLLPNWRPAAIPILKAIGTLLEQRYRLKALVMEPKVGLAYQKAPATEMLDDLARRVDVVICGSGD